MNNNLTKPAITDKPLTQAQIEMLDVIFHAMCVYRDVSLQRTRVSGHIVLNYTCDGITLTKPLHKGVFTALKTKHYIWEIIKDSNFTNFYKLSEKGLATSRQLFDSDKTN